jgi:hypothetical protein
VKRVTDSDGDSLNVAVNDRAVVLVLTELLNVCDLEGVGVGDSEGRLLSVPFDADGLGDSVEDNECDSEGVWDSEELGVSLRL